MLEVVRSAFGEEGDEDANLCPTVWRSAAYIPTMHLVAVDDHRIIGHARLGFEPAVPLGIMPLAPNNFPDLRAFMVHRLANYRPIVGTLRYCWEQAAV